MMMNKLTTPVVRTPSSFAAVTVSLVMLLVGSVSPAAAQTASSQAGATQTEDRPSIRVGVLTYFQYSAEFKNQNSFNAFDMTRGYINVTGQLARHVRFRVTPDVRRHRGGPLDGSLVFRIKYGFAEFDGLTSGAWLRMGAHQTPWLDFAEHVNRYRVQGTVFAEREGVIPGSSDFGLGYFTPLPGNYGETHVGVYNGEGYTQSESTKHKSLQGRFTIRPFPEGGGISNLRISTYYNWGWYGDGRPRRHGVVMGHYEHEKVVATAEWLAATERPTPETPADLKRRGYSGFLEIREGLAGWAGWVRFDRFDPETGIDDNSSRRLITAVAYWLRWSDSKIGLVFSDEDERYGPRSSRPDQNRFLAQVHLEF